MSIRESMFIWAKSRKAMKGYSYSREDFIELLYLKYFPMTEETLWCIWIGESAADFQLCNWDSDLLPTLYKKDEIRFEYNQANQSRSKVSCTIFAAAWMYSDLTNYEFSVKELKEIDDSSYNNPEFTHIRTRWHGWYVKDAVDCVRKYVNGREDLVKKYWKVASYRISKYDNEIMEDTIDKLYTIDWNMCPTADYINDYASDGMLDGTKFWTNTNWHSLCVIKKDWQRSVKDNYKGRKYNIYGLKNKLSSITNFWPYFYVYTLVKENALEEIKRLNEFKSALLVAIEQNSKLWHLTNDTNYQSILHYTNDKHRAKIKDIDNELKKYF